MLFFISGNFIVNWFDNLERDLYGVKKGVTIENVKVERLYISELRSVIEEIALQKQTLPENPRIDKSSGEIIAEKPGWLVDIDKTIQKVMQAEENQALEVETQKVKPEFAKQDLENTKVIGIYSTYIGGSSQRYHNIKLAAVRTNNTIIWPGETFSFNNITGPRDAQAGYQPAPVILNGVLDSGYGGGVCQLSSTIFNAVLLAELPVTERHQHSKPVHYVPPGKDATVNYGYLDFCFQNNTDRPLIIKTVIYGGKLTATVLRGGD